MTATRIGACAAAAACVLALAAALPAAEGDEYGSRGNLWKTLTAAERQEVDALAATFKTMIGASRSELAMVREATRFAEQNGFVRWDPEKVKRTAPGQRYYAINRDRSMALWVTGTQPLRSAGMRMINSHIDSVRLELKPNPLLEKGGVVALDTFVHGSIRGYQWVNLPLGLTGRIDKKDGSTTWIEIGFDENDPVLLIPDLEPHTDADLRSRTRVDAVRAEELEPVLASEPAAAGAKPESLLAKTQALIAERYGIGKDDWVSADIQIVPVTQPRDVGLDRALIAAYGLDDRLTGIINLLALAEQKSPERTAMAYLVTDEEVGSRWNIGAGSDWFRRIAAEMVRAEQDTYTDLDLMTALSRSQVITADTTSAVNPIIQGPPLRGNSALMHHGLVVKLYGPGRSANSEFIAYQRRILDERGIGWQSHSYPAGYGGGTIASEFTKFDMEVADWGVGIWSMHSTYDVCSKVDLWALRRAFQAFFEGPRPDAATGGAG